MKYWIAALFCLFIQTSLIFSQEKAFSYITGLAYTDTVIYGSTAWDHLNQFNMLTGVVFSTPLEGTDRFNSRIRMAFNHPLWAQVNRLDGETDLVQLPDHSLRYGANFLAGLEWSVPTGGELFQSTLSVGPTVDFQALSQSMILTLGMEGSAEGKLPLGEKWSFLLGLSLYYNYWGLHTVGESSRYELYIKRGWGLMVYPGFQYRY